MMKIPELENFVEMENLFIAAADGFRLAATLFRASHADAPLVIIAAATAVKRGYYEKFARFLAQHGFHALTFDYRGIGGSRPARLKGFHAEMHEWGELDLAGVIDWATEFLAPPQILYVGHSVAGQILPLAKNHYRVRAAYLVASQSGYWKLWNGKERMMVFALWYLSIPLATALFGYFPGWMLGNAEDIPAGVAREWARWGRRTNYLLSHTRDTRSKFAAVQIPLKFVSFTDDPLIAPQRAVATLASWYGSANKEQVHLRPDQIGVKAIGHFGFFRETFQETLWRDAMAWLKAHTFAGVAAEAYPQTLS
ncbi:alpha/beta fold hydrolase [candidate division KSB1 bacterium]|nr:alpha/beta fold hydrolase [candidate division KSB1 bacterium]